MKAQAMDVEAARANMIAQQIRPWHVLAEQTLAALAAIAREHFVPAAYRDLAFADVQIPLGGAAVMLEPKVSARMLEALRLKPTDAVLDIGTGSGYVAALLASLSRHVTTVEIDAALFAQAQSNLAAVPNVTAVRGDAHAGWGAAGQFDAVFISGSLPAIADSWGTALADGGRLVGIEGRLPAMEVVLLEKSGARITRQSLFETAAPRLRNVTEAVEFEF